MCLILTNEQNPTIWVSLSQNGMPVHASAPHTVEILFTLPSMKGCCQNVFNGLWAEWKAQTCTLILFLISLSSFFYKAFIKHKHKEANSIKKIHLSMRLFKSGVQQLFTTTMMSLFKYCHVCMIHTYVSTFALRFRMQYTIKFTSRGTTSFKTVIRPPTIPMTVVTIYIISLLVSTE